MSWDPMHEVPGDRLRELSAAAQHASSLERENNELRDIIAAMMIKYASGRAVLNPDVLGAVDSSLLLIDTSVPGMVVVRYGS